MNDYRAYDYEAKRPERVEGYRFDGTKEHVRWLASLDEENLEARIDTAGEHSLLVKTPRGERRVRKGMWLINRSDCSWDVLPHNWFRDKYAPDDWTDDEDPYDKEFS